METLRTRRLMMAVCVFVVGLCAIGWGRIIYVEDNIAWAEDGSSWVSAFTYLADALAAAEAGDEIRVAQGVYTPDRGVDIRQGDRGATFWLPDGVTLCGGYAGLFELDPNVRDVQRYATVLSGDLLGNDAAIEDPCDLYGHPTRTDNSDHVVIASGVGAESVLDGFVITGGHAWPTRRGRGSTAPDPGAGLLISRGSPVVRNCVFTRNAAGVGAGIYIEGGSPAICDCLFSVNGADGQGGGILCHDTDLFELARCRFEQNFARREGGGLYSDAHELRLVDCAFTENRSLEGGGMRGYVRGQLDLRRCTFADNSARQGGGLRTTAFASAEPVALTDCTFSGNHADAGGASSGSHAGGPTPSGGGLLLSGGGAELKGCAFFANIADQGGGIDVGVADRCRVTNGLWAGNLAFEVGGAIYVRTGALELDRCTLDARSGEAGGLLACAGFGGRPPTDVSVTVINSILRDGCGELCTIGCDPEDISIAYSNVEGGWPGEGNIDVDPDFVAPGGWTRRGGWIAGDYHLKSQAGRWDPIGQSWAYDEVTSPCIDAGNPNGSIGDELFPDGGAVNMGAYAGTTEASKSYFGQPLCTTNLAGDTNGDCRIDVNDLLTVLSQWWPAGPVVEQGPRITFIEPADGATLQMTSEPLTITAEIGDPETIVDVTFHIRHTNGTFSYHGQCEGQQNRNRWSGSWYWSGDTERFLSGEHVLVVALGAGEVEFTPLSWEWSWGSYRLPEGQYVISAEVTDDRGRTTVSDDVRVTIETAPRMRR